VFHIFGALAEFEREIIRERTNAGLQAARARGRRGGPKHKLNQKQVAIARQLYEGNTPVKEICDTLGISRATFYRYVTVAENQ
jgi:DNA invertase Pin-like site-specific DNA recombinase